MSVTNVPDIGTQVQVRNRNWVVRDVKRSAFETDLLGPRPREPQHRVLLASLEEDSLLEELQVIWEVEPATSVLGRFELPELTGWDEPKDMEAFLLAARWGAVASADVKALQSPFRSGIEIEEYQLDPVVRSLERPRTNLLIADDVGLGKTIEAGLVAQELMLRNRVRTVLILCPSSLQIQWQDQMRDKFGLEFRVVDSALLKDLRRKRGLFVNPWTHFPRLIASIDFIKRERPLRLFREILPAGGMPTFPRQLDLLIVDEAHNVAPSGGGRYAVESQRTQAIRLLAPHFEHRLFLSATPHNGYSESFTSLLELLDDQRFARGVAPDARQLEQVMVRRLKSDPDLQTRWDGTSRFPRRQLETLEIAYGEAERSLHELFDRFCLSRRAQIRDAYALEFVLKLLKKRLHSSPAAFLSTLQKHSQPRAEERRARPMTEGLLRQRVEKLEEDFNDDEVFGQVEQEVLEQVGGALPELSAEQQQLVHEMQGLCQQLIARGDAKFRGLLALLQETVRPGNRWGDQRVLIFTEYRDTQKWLHELLAARDLATQDRLMMLYGGMTSDDREVIKAAFQAHPGQSKVRILLATDAASEGIDLQNHCHRLVHYEIPWNPNRLEQRNGRVDRHGQKAREVLVYHFVPQGYRQAMASQRQLPAGSMEGDLEFLFRVAQNVETIRTDLGKVGPVLARQVEEAMLGKRADIDTLRAEAEAAKARKVIKFERDLKKQLRELKDRLDDSRRTLQLAPENLLAVVQVGLRLAKQTPLQQVEVSRPQGVVSGYEIPVLKGPWSQACQGLEHPHTRVRRPVVFDEELARGQDDVVLMHLNHRLVQMCLRLLRAEVWGGRELHRHALFSASRREVPEPAVVAWGRLVLIGPLGHCLHEEIVYAAGQIREGRLEAMNQMSTESLIERMHPGPARDSLQSRLTSLWETLEKPLTSALRRRSGERGSRAC